jgi:hypothetical protein
VAGGSSAAASGHGKAVAAKKKCKKGKKSAVSAKKKCKHKVVPVPLPAPMVRGNLSWTTANADLDLHAYDASGRHSGLSISVSGMEEGIPNASHSPDVQTAGSETFTDNIFVQGGTANREFSYLVCAYDDASATFTGVSASGQSSTLPLSAQADTAYEFTVPGGPPVPDPNTVC